MTREKVLRFVVVVLAALGLGLGISPDAQSQARFVITGSNSQIAGTPNNLTITALDAGGSTDAAYDGDKILTFSGASPSPTGQVPVIVDINGNWIPFGSVTVLRFSSGVASVIGSTNGVMRLYLGGTSTIAVTDGALTTTGADRLVVSVTPGPLGSFVFSLASPQINGQPFNGTNTLTALDEWGNTATSFNASTDNVTISENAPLSGTVSGLGSADNDVLNQAGNFSSGVANLTAIGMIYTGTTTAGTFTATSSTGKTGTSGSVTITIGGATKLAFAQQPTNAEAGGVISPAVTVQLKDAGDQNVAVPGVSITLLLTSGSGSLGGTVTRQTNASGLATFNDLSIVSPGQKQLTASSSGLSSAVSSLFTVTASSKPTISIWYGKRQTFRQRGVSQRWVDILGNVSDPDGIASLTASLNGGPQRPLSIGPDTRRLNKPGDFDADFGWSQLNPLPDSNSVVITAIDNATNIQRDTVIVRYVPGTIWGLPYTVAWANDASLTDSAQVVDGIWARTSSGIRTVSPGYDRLVAIGDTLWTDYEITVPITIHSIDSSGYNPISSRPAVGLLLRWVGATDDPVSGWQPKSGWRPYGSLGVYSFVQGSPRLELDNAVDYSGKRLQFEQTYNFKMRIQTTGGRTFYGLRVWPIGQAEPGTWDLTRLDSIQTVRRGSLLLLAHHVDVTYGPASVLPVIADVVPPVISGIEALTGRYSAEIRWTTNEQANARVDYGLTASYGSSVTRSSYLTSHSLAIEGLEEKTIYHYRIISTDFSGNPASSGDRLFVTTGASTITSDDFNTPTLNTNLWTPYDPLGDVTESMTGTQLSLAIPAGISHDPWTGSNRAPRVLQSATDGDFELEIKLDSPVSTSTQGAGILIQSDISNYLRFDFFSEASKTRVFAGAIKSDTGSSKANVEIGNINISPLYMRVRRERNLWTLSTSTDGTAWTERAQFVYDIVVNQVGVHALTFGSPAPAYTALFDYFRNTQTPRVRASVRVFLEGPYDPGTTAMRTLLRSGGALTSRFPGAAIPGNAVDSIALEIRNAASAGAATTRKFSSAWLMRDGTIRSRQDTSLNYVTFDTLGGNYYVVVHHLNHLPVMTSGAQLLTVTSASTYDFTGSASQAYGIGGMKQVGPAAFAMWAGNAANGDGLVNAEDRLIVKFNLGAVGYNVADLNRDGSVGPDDAALVRAATGTETTLP